MPPAPPSFAPRPYADDTPAVPLHAPPPVADWLASRLRDALPPQPASAPDLPREIAASVARFLLAQDIADAPLPPAYLDLLAFRALCAAGERPAALRYAQGRLPADADTPIPFDPEVWPGPVPLSIWSLFDQRLVRPLRSRADDGRILWMLDFRRLRPSDAGWLELTLLPGLRTLLEQIAPAFDPDGRGVLGLRGLYATGFAPSAPSRRRRPAPLAAPDIRAFCLRILSRQALLRRWPARPDVIYLDAPSR